jgi:hypothetical protein
MTDQLKPNQGADLKPKVEGPDKPLRWSASETLAYFIVHELLSLDKGTWTREMGLELRNAQKRIRELIVSGLVQAEGKNKPGGLFIPVPVDLLCIPDLPVVVGAHGELTLLDPHKAYPDPRRYSQKTIQKILQKIKQWHSIRFNPDEIRRASPEPLLPSAKERLHAVRLHLLRLLLLRTEEAKKKEKAEKEVRRLLLHLLFLRKEAMEKEEVATESNDAEFSAPAPPEPVAPGPPAADPVAPGSPPSAPKPTTSEQRADQPQQKKKQGGRPPEYDYDAIRQAAKDYIRGTGLPISNELLAEKVGGMIEEENALKEKPKERISIPKRTLMTELTAPIFKRADAKRKKNKRRAVRTKIR